jgi:hypothetical protein
MYEDAPEPASSCAPQTSQPFVPLAGTASLFEIPKPVIAALLGVVPVIVQRYHPFPNATGSVTDVLVKLVDVVMAAVGVATLKSMVISKLPEKALAAVLVNPNTDTR